MIKLMNSAMMPQPGKYELVPLTREQFVGILRDSGECDSYVGYEQTAHFVERISGVKVEVARRQTVFEDGERALVVKLAYRLPDANSKGAPVNESDYEFYMIRYSA
jgi:Domain of unknown function (DUF1874)